MMKRKLILFVSMLSSIAFFTACDTASEYEPFAPPEINGMGNATGGGEGTVTGLTDFTISLDYTPIENEHD